MYFMWSLLLLSVFWTINGLASDSRCSRTINVGDQKFGIIYEYITGYESTCSYELRANEGQKILVAINQIGLLPKQQNEACLPGISISDVLFTGEVVSRVSICNADDAKTTDYMSAVGSVKVEFVGPSDSEGILLIQFWFVEDVRLIRTKPTEPPKEVILPDLSEPIVTLECPDWGADIKLERCSCVEYGTGKLTNLEPPFCLIPSQTLTTKCLNEANEARHQLATAIIWTEVDPVPVCDEQGNYDKVQCNGDSRFPCRCVDPIHGNLTGLIPPECEELYPFFTTTTMTPMTSEAPPLCKLQPCEYFCVHGLDIEYGCSSGCICMEDYSNTFAEDCQEEQSYMKSEIEEWKKLTVKSTPYPWIPECSEDGNYDVNQCNYEGGCFCVDSNFGSPNGKKFPDCGTYKKCVSQRIIELYRVLRAGGHKKTAKVIRGLLTGNDANDMRTIMDELTVQEEKSIMADPTVSIPLCNVYGDYEALQCNVAGTTCWCSDIDGNVITESESSNFVPDCSIYSRHNLQKPIKTDEQRSISVGLNDSGTMFCNFQNISESENMFVFWSHNGIPIDSFDSDRCETTTYYVSNTMTTWLTIINVTADDVGSYRCEIADGAHDFFYKPNPIDLKVWNLKQEPCAIPDCPTYCGLGHKTDENQCFTCECFQKEELGAFTATYKIQSEFQQQFGKHNGGCEAKRQLIKKELLSYINTYLVLPQCDSDGNYEVLQNMPYFGRVCVDRINGQLTGRVVPDCDELSDCIKEKIETVKEHIAFFSNETIAQEVYKTAMEARSIGDQLTLIDEASTYIPGQYTGDVTGLPPIKTCGTHSSLYYFSRAVCSPDIKQCWCIDENGNEQENTRAGINENMPPCHDYVPPLPGPTILNVTEGSSIARQIGSSVTLGCEVSKFSPHTYVMWTTPNGMTFEQKMALDKRFKFVGDKLTDFSIEINDIQQKDFGSYICNLYNYQSSSQRKKYSIYELY